MSDELFGRYRDALLLGHRAARRGDVETALEAYAEAASCAPHRALPWASQAALLLEHARAAEAVDAYREALHRDPSDGDSVAGLRRAEALVDGRPLPEPEVPIELVDDAVAVPAGAPEPAGTEAGVTPAADDVPGPGSTLEADEALELALEAAIAVEAGDRTRAVELTLAAARAHLARRRIDAAIDLCLRALPVAPDEPELHLFLAERWLERGWGALAAEKLELLDRLASLTDDPVLAARVASLAGRGAGPGAEGSASAPVRPGPRGR